MVAAMMGKRSLSSAGELQEGGEDSRTKKRVKKEAQPLDKFLSLAENGDTVAGEKVYSLV